MEEILSRVGYFAASLTIPVFDYGGAISKIKQELLASGPDRSGNFLRRLLGKILVKAVIHILTKLGSSLLCGLACCCNGSLAPDLCERKRTLPASKIRNPLPGNREGISGKYRII